ncbi:GNAT family N-acetyltransferase [Exilibacterium tricleocarpae]|uniref:GNAT family N-acetyltransferase n=1 Tax=Exilibacterium tricleocarpae TaxID=2591008 RepID=A0A545T8Q2_9GAMM|nr:GNAT family N-acetyltransferase [Exilibacterium tricleocarpae]
MVDWETNHLVLTDLRTQVFIVEQDVPEEEELDGLDPGAFHFIARDAEGKAGGTARLLPSGQVGRMAVLSPYRQCGIGSALLRYIIDWHRDRALPPLFLHAQTHAIPFYQKLGFQARGPEFLDAGIPHREMVMDHD